MASKRSPAHRTSPDRLQFGRRTWLSLASVGTAAVVLSSRARAAEPPRRRNIKLGFDNFSVRAMAWKAPALIDYAVKLAIDSLFITDLDAFETFEAPYLIDLKKRAADQGVQFHLGTWSICPTSNTFKKTWGTAEQHLALAIKVAAALGSPVMRVVLGNAQDRASAGGIEARIRDTVKVLKNCRSRARDAGVKIAMENHAGDLQAAEVVALINAAGKDFVGANVDAGNAVWTAEDPLRNLEILAPHVLTTSLRDSMIWESEKGATVQWTAMGDGVVDFAAYLDHFEAKCPGVPVHIETISGFNKELPYLDPEYWKLYPKMSAADFARFVRLAKKGKAMPAWQPPAGVDRKQAEQEFQKRQIERSMDYCKRVLGLGVRS